MEKAKRKIKDEPSEDDFKKIEADEVCPICEGTGEVSAKCECQIGNEDDDFDDQG